MFEETAASAKCEPQHTTMPTAAEVRQVVEDVVGTKGDDTVFEYVVSILEDGEFEFGADGEDAFEAFGAVLVQSSLLDVVIY